MDKFQKPTTPRYSEINRRKRIPAFTPMFFVMTPMRNGNTAPPEIAVIINPDISLDLSGIRSTAIEKINGKILADPNPIITIAVLATIMLMLRNSRSKPRIVKRADTIRKEFAFIFFNIIAPKNREPIKAKI